MFDGSCGLLMLNASCDVRGEPFHLGHTKGKKTLWVHGGSRRHYIYIYFGVVLIQVLLCEF